VRRSVEDPMFDMEINIRGTLNLLQNAVQHNVKKFIFASTGGAIYGEQDASLRERNTRSDRSAPTALVSLPLKNTSFTTGKPMVSATPHCATAMCTGPGRILMARLVS